MPADAAPIALYSEAFQAASPAARIGALDFLVGRWTGTAPDGTTVFEEYDIPDGLSLRSRRFADANFSTATDGSVVAIEGTDLVSRWGEFSWRASEVREGFVLFEPINAPSSFSWRRVDPGQVEVTQRWRDAEGREQSYRLVLRKLDRP